MAYNGRVKIAFTINVLLRASLVLASLAALSGAARAGTFPFGAQVGLVGAFSGTGTANTSTPNDYPAASTANLLTVGIILNATTPADVVLQGVASGGTTQYRVQVGIGNLSGVAYTGFRF